MLALVALAASVAIGCASFNSRVFRATKLAVDAAYGSVAAYKTWHHNATNGAPDEVRAKLDADYAKVKLMSQQFGATASTVDRLREEYAANVADTNKLALTAAMDAMAAQSTNIVGLIQFLMAPPVVPNKPPL